MLMEWQFVIFIIFKMHQLVDVFRYFLQEHSKIFHIFKNLFSEPGMHLHLIHVKLTFDLIIETGCTTIEGTLLFAWKVTLFDVDVLRFAQVAYDDFNREDLNLWSLQEYQRMELIACLSLFVVPLATVCNDKVKPVWNSFIINSYCKSNQLLAILNFKKFVLLVWEHCRFEFNLSNFLFAYVLKLNFPLTNRCFNFNVFYIFIDRIFISIICIT